MIWFGNSAIKVLISRLWIPSLDFGISVMLNRIIGEGRSQGGLIDRSGVETQVLGFEKELFREDIGYVCSFGFVELGC